MTNLQTVRSENCRRIYARISNLQNTIFILRSRIGNAEVALPLERILELCARAKGMKVAEIVSPARYRSVADIRSHFYGIAQHYGYSQSAMARITNRHPSTVNYALGERGGLLTSDKHFRKDSDDLLNYVESFTKAENRQKAEPCQ